MMKKNNEVEYNKYEFCCPCCNGRKFGTSDMINNDSEGHCHSGFCTYSWKRTDDAKVFTRVKRDYLEDRVEELEKENEELKNRLLCVAMKKEGSTGKDQA